MDKWSPEILFAVTYVVSALTAIGPLLMSNKVLSARLVIGTVLIYGGLGCGFGTVVFEYGGGRAAPWRVVGAGMLVGVKALKISDLTAVLRRVLNMEKTT